MGNRNGNGNGIGLFRLWLLILDFLLAFCMGSCSEFCLHCLMGVGVFFFFLSAGMGTNMRREGDEVYILLSRRVFVSYAHDNQKSRIPHWSLYVF